MNKADTVFMKFAKKSKKNAKEVILYYTKALRLARSKNESIDSIKKILWELRRLKFKMDNYEELRYSLEEVEAHISDVFGNGQDNEELDEILKAITDHLVLLQEQAEKLYDNNYDFEK